MVKYGIARLDREASSILTNGAALYKTCVKPNVLDVPCVCSSVRNSCVCIKLVWSLLAYVCMIGACVVVSTIRISRFQMQTGFDWSFPSIHQEIRIILVFRSGLVTFLLKCGEYCGGHHVQCWSMSFEVWWWLWWTPSSSFSFEVLWRLWLSCSDICQPGLYERLSPKSNSIWDWCWIWWGMYMGQPRSGFWLLVDSGKSVGACKQLQRCLSFYLAFFFGSCVTLYR